MASNETILQIYTSRLDLNNIISEKVLSTTDDLVFDNFQFSDPSTKYKGKSITVQGNSSVLPNVNLSLVGTDHVTLSPSFSVSNQANFKAYLEPFICQTAGFNQSRRVQPSLLSSTDTLVSSQNKNPLVLIPNPTSGSVLVNCKGDEITDLKVLNLFGGEVLAKKLINPDSKILLSTDSFPSGPYFVQILTSNGETFVKKLIVRH